VQGGATGVGRHLEFLIGSGSPSWQITVTASWPEQQYPEVEAFIDKFLLGDHNANTRVEIHPYPEVDHAKWVDW